MANIYYLNANDFSMEGQHLAANIGGLTFVMFHSSRCSHCVNFLPEFKMLPGSMRGVNFGICSVDNENRIIASKSQQSTTPIAAVPKFILYNDGIPYVEYSGQRSRMAVLNFLNEVISKLDQKQTFMRPRRSRQESQMAAPTQSVQSMQPIAPTRPTGMSGQGQPQQSQQSQNYKITPSTGVKEYETSYGRPYNTTNESDFLEYESAYKQQMGK